MDHQTMLRAEVIADVYGGENHDQVSNHFQVYAEGDMDEDTNNLDIILKCAELPPGTIIEVRYPACPECGLARFDKLDTQNRIIGHADKCPCGHDWNEWVLDQYS